MILIAAKIIFGLVFLVVGGELLVRGATVLASAFRISPLVIGLTVVAFGTSAPELGVSLKAAYSGNAGVAIGNVIGSNIINILFVIGAAAVVAPLIVNRSLVRRDVPLMILASAVTWGVASDGAITRLEGAVLFAALCVYLVSSIRSSRRESSPRSAGSIVDSGDVQRATSGQAAEGVSAVVLDPTVVGDASGELSFPQLAGNAALLVVGLVLLGAGANFLVEGATTVATRLGVSNLVIGLTVVAIGTSLPEVVTSVVASYRGQRDIAVGNVVGSNLFNLLCVLGLTATVSPEPIPVSADALAFDFPVMVAVAVVCLPVFWAGYLVKRFEGAAFLGVYVLYTVAVIAKSRSTVTADWIHANVYALVMPVAVLVGVVAVVLARRGEESSPPPPENPPPANP